MHANSELRTVYLTNLTICNINAVPAYVFNKYIVSGNCCSGTTVPLSKQPPVPTCI